MIDSDRLINWLTDCRQTTLDLVKNIPSAKFNHQPHPDFSPIGWHLGHIAYTESLWLLQKQANLPNQFSQYQRLFAADGLPKNERINLPSTDEIYSYLSSVRQAVLTWLNQINLDKHQRLIYWLIQHESQHGETIRFLSQLQGIFPQSIDNPNHTKESIWESSMVEIPAGKCLIGREDFTALDNERNLHSVYLETYQIDRYLVTNQQYQIFITEKGYHYPEFWSEAGWLWRNQHNINKPLYWQNNPQLTDHPVMGVSYYEAEAYAKFVHKRLPTELEWEKAASWDEEKQLQLTYPWGEKSPDRQLSNHQNNHLGTTSVNAYPVSKSPYGCYDMLGNVWEWTSSWFSDYPGFIAYPYRGYSQVYFDRQHRVLRGGSFATYQYGLRNSFRNWYHPWVRQIFAGFRCCVS